MNTLGVILCVLGAAHAQLKFGGGGSSSSSSSSSSTKSQGAVSTDTRFISTGSELIDGGILGVGAGLLGGAVLSGALGGGQQSAGFNTGYNPCGRRQTSFGDSFGDSDKADGDSRIFGLFGGNTGGNNGCYCGNGRRRRDVGPGAAEEDAKTRFFGLETLLGGGQQNSGCGCNCGYNQGFTQGSSPQQQGGYNQGYNQGFHQGASQGQGSSSSWNQGSSSSWNQGSSGSVQQRCQCNNNLTFQDRYGNTHGACRRADETGRTWCYTYGGCPDSQPSK